jgi:hypothetical protein
MTLVAYPTNHLRRRDPKVSKKNGRSSVIAARRVSPPEIFVKCMDRDHTLRDPYARARLRNRNGYLYLTWRDGQRVRCYYLGKAPRKSPTADLTSSAAAGAAGRAAARDRRRGKLGNP